ncbi:recombinase family protein [Enterococcus viikkiensis]
MKIIQKIEPTIPKLAKRKKVAAYARVSVEKGRTMHSLSAQVSYYSKLIQKNAEWEYAGVYSDGGISGASTKKREGFKQMVEDAENGEIDIILTKSISRFARNTVDLLETVRHLKAIGVEVWFEKENIHSLSGDGELMLSILASFAQEEITSLSNNIKWSIQKKYMQGKANARFRIYGYRWEGDNLVIQPDEAKVVKLIYDNYLNNFSAEETAAQLREMGVKGLNGGKFSAVSVRQMLKNITYTGNLVLQKYMVTDPFTKKLKRNHGELSKYYVENNHEAIIPMEVWQKVQDEIARRRRVGQRANISHKIYPFTSKVRCSKCGKNYIRGTRLDKRNNRRRHYWTCWTKRSKGRDACFTKEVPEYVLNEKTAEVLGLDNFDEKIFESKIERIDVIGDNRLDFVFFDGQIKTVNWESKFNYKGKPWTEERMQWQKEGYVRDENHPPKRRFKTFSRYIQCGYCGKYYISTLGKLSGGKKVQKWSCYTKKAFCPNPHDRRYIPEAVLEELVCDVLNLETFDVKVMEDKIEKLVAYSDEIKFIFKDGHDESRKLVIPRAKNPEYSQETLQKMSEKRKEWWRRKHEESNNNSSNNQ